ncbi:ChaN family lipoprotein [Gammaproteobacteria bacterium]|nr:ChaN family lipoprotein [Gammaproteobacteria bacterium]
MFLVLRIFAVLLVVLPILSCVQVSETVDADEGIEINASHYKIYTSDGSPAQLEELIEAAKKAEVTFLGETHDDPVAHFLEVLFLEELADSDVALSLEMFEMDVQYVLDEYLAGLIREDHLIKSGRAWENYTRDYKPLIELAKTRQLPVVAANTPRRYVNMVSRNGAEVLLSLSDQAKASLPPLPFQQASTAYAEKFTSLMEESRGVSNSDDMKPDAVEKESSAENIPQGERFDIVQGLQAQSLWDAGMAYSINRALENATKVLHVNGSFHSAQGMGILDHLQTYRPNTDCLVITIIPADNFPEFSAEEMAGQGDFIIVTDSALLPISE